MSKLLTIDDDGFDNKFDQCAKLEPQVEEQNGKINLRFTISFGEQLKRDVKYKKLITIRELKFAIRKGELRMTIKNGTVSPEDIRFAKSFPVQRTVKVEKEESNSITSTGQIGSKLKSSTGPIPWPDSEIGVQYEEAVMQGGKRTLSADLIMYFIKANVSDTEPRWVFYRDIDDRTLYGLIIKFIFATVTVLSLPLRIRYTFHVEPKDVIYTNIKLWELTDVVNKQRLLQRSLTKDLFGDSEIISNGEVIVS